MLFFAQRKFLIVPHQNDIHFPQDGKFESIPRDVAPQEGRKLTAHCLILLPSPLHSKQLRHFQL